MRQNKGKRPRVASQVERTNLMGQTRDESSPYENIRFRESNPTCLNEIIECIELERKVPNIQHVVFREEVVRYHI